MQNRTVARAGAVAVVAVVLIVASQLLARTDPGPPPSQLDPNRPTVPPAVTATTAPAAPVATTAPLPPITGPVRLDERSQIDGRGVGPVEAGMTLGEAEQAAGRRFAIVGRDESGAACFGAEPEGLIGLRFAVRGPVDDPREGRIVRVEATATTWSTVSGARVGSTVTEIKRLYRGRVEESPDKRLLTVPLRDGGRSYAVAFVTSEREVVSALRSGDAAAVAPPEGCG